MLNYEPAAQKYKPTPQDRVWLWKRLAYYCGQLAFLAAVSIEFGPNLFLFHSPFRPGREYYLGLTQQVEPMITAIKGYNRDNGKLPVSSWEVHDDYLPATYDGPDGDILSWTSVTLPVPQHRGVAVIEYDFAPATEGWIIHSARFDGRLSAPLVAPGPRLRPPPATVPTTSSANPPNAK